MTNIANRTMSTIALLQKNSLPSLVQQELERMILAGDLAAGDKLNEVSLAEMLGVSRGPVREAFRALEEVGLVQQEKNCGVFVRQISTEEADDIYEVRAALDELIGRKLATTITEAQIQELHTLLSRMDGMVASDDVDGYSAMNLVFHDLLLNMTNNQKLIHTYRRLVNELSLFRRSALAELARNRSLPTSIAEHHKIVEAIATGNAQDAGSIMREHALAGRDRMHRALAVQSDAELHLEPVGDLVARQ
ncbi:phosphonate utilization associated transcriptional regulator [Glaciimonas soli]|uniref:Phosphonate utilization associated transcriptional regulator n=1 Tax=Glaciimonas soli TaxID=2590999 RepID=A0A843YKJ8_9BURK|nr:phosphonate utilization associated transcriptional regulator [Glaciimonas soli]MQR00349.1 phosphonate utilization associated transcriptional regulator [Glaciimonas soli]